ncbi:MAG: hypothetical protein J0H09_29865 [Burkholderiales bacterium]|nr:hypothetical protein [Burkholderiales bacterium]
MKEKAKAGAAASAGLVARSGVTEAAHATGRYSIECRAADGTLRWREDLRNLVTTAGKNDALDKYLAGSSYTAAFYVGLINESGYTGVNAADTMSSHSGWTEFAAYSQSNRPAAAFSAASSGSKSTSAAASYTINGSGTVKGAFLATDNTKSGTTGVLYSAGAFPADRPVQSGDTLNVSYTASL